jgi:hypothetical protein
MKLLLVDAHDDSINALTTTPIIKARRMIASAARHRSACARGPHPWQSLAADV